MTQIICTAVIKGGTGKTTTAAALVEAAAINGKRALAIDLDPQANLTMMLGTSGGSSTSFDILHGAPAAEAIQPAAIAGVDIIAASANLATEQTKMGSGARLRDAIEPIKKQYDLIVIDTPPQMNDLIYNALNAATGLIIPLEADTGSLQGLYQIKEIAARLKASNKKLRILGAVITRYDERPKLNRYMHDVLIDKCKALRIPYLCTIRAGIAAREASAMQESIFLTAPKSKPAQDYLTLYSLITAKK